MSKESNHTAPHQKHHGTAKSYVIGFVLSLVFTLIPYYMVVEKSVSGYALLATILGFAVVQLIIQVVFFLHLGREPNPRFNTWFLVATVGAIMAVTGGSIWIIHHLHANMTPTDVKQKLVDDESIAQIGGEKTGSCQTTGENHRVVIKDGIVFPFHTDASLCDTLSITNEDDATREIAFGPHPTHGTYAGKTERSIRTGKSWTITLSQPGTHQFHDHEQAETNGEFTVNP